MQEEHTEEDWGRLHVTRRCCGAATCRNIAPELLGAVIPAGEKTPDNREPTVLPGSYEEGAFTGVLRQPRSQADFLIARTAVAACPFGALRLEPPAREVGGRAASGRGSPWRDWPQRLEEHVWAVGHPSHKNFGALSYFIERADGNVLIDPPKPSDDLYRWIDEHGGLRWLFLTHRDHAHHHAEIAARFPGCVRVIGAADVNRRESEYQVATDDVENQLGDQLAPMSLDGTPIAEADLPNCELVVLPQPGHTPGSLCLLYRGRFLFSGDHLAYSRTLGHPISPRLQCWEDWGRQTRSVRYLATLATAGQLRFSWLLPGHGEWHHFASEPTAANTAQALSQALAWMEHVPSGHVPLWRWVLFAQSRMKPKSALGRAVRLIGGEGAGSDAWLLPAAVRPALPDYDPIRTQATRRRLARIAATAIAATAGIIWLTRRTP